MTTHAYEKTLAQLESDASDAHPRALHRLGRVVLHGFRGAARDVPRGMNLLRDAAAAGGAAAAYELGQRAHRGDGAPKDEVEARRWWKRAAELGDIDAMSNLLDGDDEDRQRWIVLAAAAGQPYAKTRLNELLTGAVVSRASLEAFAARPLDELARASENETLNETFSLRGTKEQMNALVGRWLTRVEAVWPDVVVTSERGGAVVDFPGPAMPEGLDDEDGVQTAIAFGGRKLECELTLADADEQTWSLWILATPPLPESSVTEGFLRGLEEEARGLGVAISRE